MKRCVIAVIGRKGGAGKTTTALNLAGALAERSQAPLLVDLVPQESLARLVADGVALRVLALGDEAQRHVARGNVASWLGDVLAPSRMVVLDTPPLLGDIMDAVISVADYVVLPTRLIKPDIDSLNDTLTHCAARQQALIVPNAVLVRNGTHRDMLSILRSTYGRLVWDEAIPQSVVIEEALNAGLPVVRYKTRSALARSYRTLAAAVVAS
jgi:chromosome partitioning protein